MADGRLYTSIQVSRMTGATGAQLRNWDKQGVLCPQRTGEGISNNRKLYTDTDIETVHDILLFQELGMQLKEIRTILNAPEEEQRRQIALCTERLQQQYSRLRGRIALSSLGETVGTAHLREEAKLAGGYDPLGDAYAEDENIQQITRWIKTRPMRDLELFSQELGDIALRFQQLSESADWTEAQQAIADFCDFWSERFGWPSAGQMLSLHTVFSDGNAMTAVVDEAAGEGAAGLMADLFFLAWASSALECLDDILAYLNQALLGMGRSGMTDGEAIAEAADVLAAFVSEFSNRAFIHASELDREQSARLSELATAVFDLLESAALDEDLECYLELEEFAAIDGPALESARNLLAAYLDGRLEKWLTAGGETELQARAGEWLDTLQAQWLCECGASNEAERSNPLDDHAFRRWFDEWFAQAHPTPPETAWAREDESIARIKESLEAAARESLSEDEMG